MEGICTITCASALWAGMFPLTSKGEESNVLPAQQVNTCTICDVINERRKND